METIETWKPCPSYPNYEASSIGRIRNTQTGGIRKPKVKATGYLYTNINHTPTPIHRLVCEAFHGVSTLTVNHKDGNKLNNREDNLEWLSRGDNIRHALKTGLHKRKKPFDFIEQWKDNQLIHIYTSYAEVEEAGFRRTNVGDCIHKRIGTKTHKGFTWIGIEK